jgi:acetyl-CoA acetyltransferase
MTRFGKHLDRTLKSLTAEAVQDALTDADMKGDDLQAAWIGNVAAGTIVGQVCIQGQVALRTLGIGRIPVVNVKNACASASTALHEACSMVSAGLYDVVLAAGAEKLYTPEKEKLSSVFDGCLDFEDFDQVVADLDERRRAAGFKVEVLDPSAFRSVFMDVYAAMTAQHMQAYGTTQRQFAAVSAKNSRHGALNPKAQYRDINTIEQVLAAREITYPLTLPMCSPIGDGAAAAIIVSEKKAREIGLSRCVRVRSTSLMSGWDHGAEEMEIVEATAANTYADAGLGPNDVDVVELHDAAAPSEIMHTESLGFCDKGDGGKLVESGATELGGRLPVNPSGGLLRKGHPVGATGLAQIYELTLQLRGEAGPRQVEGARIALAENGGGFIGGDAAAMVISLLSKD